MIVRVLIVGGDTDNLIRRIHDEMEEMMMDEKTKDSRKGKLEEVRRVEEGKM